MRGRLKAVFIMSLVIASTMIRIAFAHPGPDSTDAVIRRSAIRGRVIDRETRYPLEGASVVIAGTKMGATSDKDGHFTIAGVQVGSYILQFSYTGYESLIKTDIVIKSGRTSFVRAELKMAVIEIEGITVEAGYFTQVEEEPTSSVNFSAEEIRRAPGSAGDISRIVSMLPSIAKVNDSWNGLVVRGGNPVENAFYLDNMEIPNINHYPMQGSTSGPIGLLNVDFLQEVNFSAGGFSATYGDKLSSVMELTFREGNRQEFDAQIDMNMAGFGLVGEGPLAGGKGSWLLSVRKSYLDLLVDAIGTGVAPRYSDYQGKITLDLSPRSKLTILGIAGLDHIDFDKENSIEDGKNQYGKADFTEHLLGVNWRCTWNKNWYSNTSLSQMYTKYEHDFQKTATDKPLINDQSTERSVSLRNINYYRINGTNRLKFGFEAKRIIDEYDSFAAGYHDRMGNLVPELNVDKNISALKSGCFLNYIWNPTARLETTFGLRYDYFSYNGNAHISPRYSFSYKLTENTSLTGSAGIYYQSLPLAILSRNENNKDLKDPVAYHYILGFNHLLAGDTRLTLEVFDKEYDNFPLDPSLPFVFPADEGGSHEGLVDKGKARSRGVELVIHKKLARDFYGMVCGSVYQSRYRGFDGLWRDRIFGNRYTFSIEGGYIASKKWEFSMRWVFAGGRPYTPYDLEASKALNSGICDLARINGARHPDYHSMNFRIDRRFNFKNSNLILYWDFWNTYKRKNIANYYWNELENKQDREDQWGFMPVFGLEWEF